MPPTAKRKPYPHFVTDAKTPVSKTRVRRVCPGCQRTFEVPRSLEDKYRTCGALACRAVHRARRERWSRPRKAELPLLPMRPQRSDVVKQLKALAAEGVKLGSKVLRIEYPALSSAIYRLFRNGKEGPLHSAFRAAGLDPVAIAKAGRAAAGAKNTKYTPAVVDALLRDRLAAGEPVYPAAMRNAGLGGAVDAANRWSTGGYAAAVMRVGGSAGDCRAYHDRKGHPEEVERALCERLDRGYPMNSGAMQDDDKALFAAACTLFGSWELALHRLGLDPDVVQREIHVDAWQGRVFQNLARDVFAVIRPRWDAHFIFRYVDSDGSERRLRPDWVDLDTGIWIDAKLNAWGASVRSSLDKYRQYTRVLRVIALHGHRKDIDGAKFSNIFDFEHEPGAARVARLFACLRTLKKSLKRPSSLARWESDWTTERIVEGVLALPAEHRHSRGVQEHATDLYQAAMRHIPGGWNGALALAGLSADAIRKHQPYLNKDAVDTAIKRRRRSPLSLNQSELQRDPAGQHLLNSARHVYGSWPTALVANAVEPRLTYRDPNRAPRRVRRHLT